MAYVIDYTIVCGGLPYQAKGTDHRDALTQFLRHPAGLTCGYHQGRLEVGHGEHIHVIGPTQESFSAHMHYNSGIQRAREDVAAGRKGDIRGAQQRLRRYEDNPVQPPRQVTVEFVMQAVTRFAARTVAEVEHEEHARTVLREQIRETVEQAGEIQLLVSYERQTPIRDTLQGVPQEYDEDGVWLKDKLIPWSDIIGVEPLKVEVTA